MLSFVSEHAYFDAQTNNRHTVVVFEGAVRVPMGGEAKAAIRVEVSCSAEQAEGFKRKRDVLFTFDEQVAAPTVLAATVVPPQTPVVDVSEEAVVVVAEPAAEDTADPVPKTRTRKPKA